jgi:hypothetical protein
MATPWRWFWTSVVALLAGGIALPAAAYLAARRFVGTYEGSRGVAGYVGSIWEGALAAEPQAWAVLLAPLALVACWAAILRGLRRRG